MKVKMKATVAGTIQGKRTVAGEVVDLPDGAAVKLCSQGLAEPVAEKPSERAETRTGGMCAGTTAAGEPCSNRAGDDGFCRHHGDG